MSKTFKKQTHIDNLVEGLVLTAEICCNGCDAEGGILAVVDESDAADNLYRKGWRGTENNIYCPKCAKKKLKS